MCVYHLSGPPSICVWVKLGVRWDANGEALPWNRTHMTAAVTCVCVCVCVGQRFVSPVESRNSSK